MSDDAYGATVAKRRLSRRLFDLRRAVWAHRQPRLRLAGLGPWQGRAVRGQPLEASRDERHQGPAAGLRGRRSRARGTRAARHAGPGPGPGGGTTRTCSRTSSPGSRTTPSGSGSSCRCVLPGLLQTRDYTEALLRAGLRPPAWQQRAMEARLRRQQILDRTDGTAPRLIAVITEASLMYRWGTKGDRREQIEHLVAAQRPARTWSCASSASPTGRTAGMQSMVNIFDFAGRRAKPGLSWRPTSRSRR